jgi:hypothetical protein
MCKINKIPNRLKKKGSSIVNGYNRVKDKKSWVTKIELRSNEGQCVNS